MSSEDPGPQANFSVLRIIVLAFPLLVLAAIWVEIAEIHKQAGDMSGGVPPTGAFAVFIPFLILAALIPALRRRWNYTRGELIMVFSMLVVAVPIFGDGFWRHFVALQHENHRSRYLDMAMLSSPLLWPNHGNVLDQASVEDEPGKGSAWTISNPRAVEKITSPNGDEPCLRIIHENESDQTTIGTVINASTTRNFPLPLTRYALYTQVRLDDPGLSPHVSLMAGSRPDRLREIKSLRQKTRIGPLAMDRFKTIGGIDYMMPRDLKDRFFINLRFKGKGTLYVRNISLIDTEVVYRYLEGYKEATPEVYAGLPDEDRSSTRLRPERGFNLPYLKHMLFGLVPWDAWVKPLATWFLVVAVIFLGMYCLITIYYRHWEEGDRLTFPLQNFLLDITRGDTNNRLALLRSAPFWIAFGLCAIHLSLVELHTYYENVPSFDPKLELSQLMPAGSARQALEKDWAHQGLTVNIRPLYVAVAFFMSVELSFSLVAIFLLTWIYRFACSFTPLKTLRISDYMGTPYPFGFQMAAGGLIFMAVYCVVAARKHLVGVAKKVLVGGPLDDSGEAMSYRMAAFGLVVAAGMFVLFAQLTGISTVFILGFLAVYLLLALSAARIRAETGFPHVEIMIAYPHRIMIGAGGVLAFGYNQWVFAGQAMFLYMGSFLLIAPLLAEAMAAATRVGVPLKRLTVCLMAAFILAMPLGGIVSMSSAYTYGAINMSKLGAEKRHEFGWNVGGGIEGGNKTIARYFNEHPDEDQVITKDKISAISKIQKPTLVVIGISFVITALLALARVIWLGFPLHPLGFALAFTPAMATLWSSIGVGSLIKHLGLRFGGVQLIRRVLRPFCVGLFIGDIITTVLWTIIECFIRGSAPPGFSGHSGF